MAATAKKTIFDWHENKVKKEANRKVQEANRANVIRLIKNIQLTDNQIVDSLDLPLSFVQAIRKEITDLS